MTTYRNSTSVIFPAQHETQLLWRFLRRDFVFLISKSSASAKENAVPRSDFSCLSTGNKITVSDGEQFWVSCSSEYWWILLTGPPCSELRRKRNTFGVVDYSSRQRLVSSSWVEKELGKNWHGIGNIWSFTGSTLHQTSNEWTVQLRIEFLMMGLQKLSRSRLGLYSDVEVVFFVDRESTHNLFNILLLKE